MESDPGLSGPKAMLLTNKLQIPKEVVGMTWSLKISVKLQTALVDLLCPDNRDCLFSTTFSTYYKFVVAASLGV